MHWSWNWLSVAAACGLLADVLLFILAYRREVYGDTFALFRDFPEWYRRTYGASPPALWGSGRGADDLFKWSRWCRETFGALAPADMDPWGVHRAYRKFRARGRLRGRCWALPAWVVGCVLGGLMPSTPGAPLLGALVYALGILACLVGITGLLLLLRDTFTFPILDLWVARAGDPDLNYGGTERAPKAKPGDEPTTERGPAVRRASGPVFAHFTELAWGEKYFVEVPLTHLASSLRERVPPPGMFRLVGLPQDDPGMCRTTRDGLLQVWVALAEEEVAAARSRGITLDASRAGWVPPFSWTERQKRLTAMAALRRAAELGLW